LTEADQIASLLGEKRGRVIMKKVTMRSKKTAAAEFSARLLRDVDAALYKTARRPEAIFDRADSSERDDAQPEMTSIG
jgi:hypothetical protein